MVVLGLLLAAAAITVAVGIALENDAATDITLFGQVVPGVTQQWQLFFLGVVTAVVFILGTMAVFVGTGRRIRRRREAREIRREQEDSLSTLEMERSRLQRELADARRGAPGRAQGPAPEPEDPRVGGRSRNAPPAPGPARTAPTPPPPGRPAAPARDAAPPAWPTPASGPPRTVPARDDRVVASTGRTRRSQVPDSSPFFDRTD